MGMRHPRLYALLLTFLTACNSTDYRHALELRVSEDEPGDAGNAFGESDGAGVAYTVYRRDTDEGLPIGFELGIGQQSDGATHGELNHAWMGAFREFGESVVRPFVGVGVINTELVRGAGADAGEFGPYAQVGLRVYLTPAYHMAIGYRESFGIEDTVDGQDYDLTTIQVFFSLGFGF
ncbi:MAG: hypothetical protein ACI8QC_000614 [Planctomycetota bacterium]|jgi:hypothetical protein